MMAYYLKVYLLTFVGFLAIDMVWLAVVARGFYRERLGFSAQRPAQLVGSHFLLLAFRSRAARVCDCPRCGGRLTAQGPASGRLFWIGHLRDLRSDKPRNGQELALDGDACRHDVGHGPGHGCQLPRIPGRTLATVTSGGGQDEYLTRLLWLPIIPQFFRSLCDSARKG